MLYKSLIADKADITNRVVTGFCSVFGNKDSYGDIVCNGAFNKTIAENRKRFRHLWQHNTFEPPTAVIKDIKEVDRADLPDVVKTAYPECTGGLMVAREYLDTPRGNEILQGIKAGAINEMSFMYDIVKYDFVADDKDQYGGTLYLRELKFYESSDVNWGANEATVASKQFLKMALQAGKQYIALTGTKEGRVLSAKNVTKLKTAIETLEDILASSEPVEDTTTEIDQTNPISAGNDLVTSLNKEQTNSLIAHIMLAQRELYDNGI